MASHLMLELMFFFFNFQRCSLSVVKVLLCSNLKDDLCKLNLLLNSFSVSPVYLCWLFEIVSVTVALYTTHLVRQLPSSGHECFCRQLHSLLSSVHSFILCSCSKRWLLLEIVCLISGRQPKLIFIGFLLKILLSLLSFGKCSSINARNVLATFVATLMLNGGLNQVIFRFLVLFFSLFLSVHVLSNCRFVLCPFFFRASVYMGRGGGACLIEYLRIFRIGR